MMISQMVSFTIENISNFSLLVKVISMQTLIWRLVFLFILSLLFLSLIETLPPNFVGSLYLEITNVFAGLFFLRQVFDFDIGNFGRG